jgi:acetyl-CoA acetyltransferase
MPEAVIVTALRTPIGTANKGTLRDTDAYTLADHGVGAAAAAGSGSTMRPEGTDGFGRRGNRGW